MTTVESSEDYYDWFTIWKDVKPPARETEWIEQLLAHPPAIEPERRKGGLIQEYLSDRLNYASRSVRELEQELYVRHKLHEQSVEQLDYQISRAALGLEQFKGWAVGYNRGVDDKRIELERTLHDLRKEKRSWRVRLWDDVVRLRSELREKRQEYEAMLRLTGMQVG